VSGEGLVLDEEEKKRTESRRARAEAISIFPEGQGLTPEEERQQVRSSS